MADLPPICDYEGSDYHARFWQGKGREYEDRVERVALRRLMPPSGHTLIEIGSGYGRLADEYKGYDRVVLFDYSRSLLREAQVELGKESRYIFVAGNWYEMPFVDGLFDTIVQVRTLHHAADVPSLFTQLARIGKPTGTYVLEYANKKNLKAMLRHGLGRQTWSPYDLEPVEFAELNYDFHPRWIRRELTSAGFVPGRVLTVSHFRLGLLKRFLPTGLLVALDSVAQLSGPAVQLTPSVFIRNQHPAEGEPAEAGTMFACPKCGTALGSIDSGRIHCPKSSCGRQWRVSDGLYDFKEPVPPA